VLEIAQGEHSLAKIRELGPRWAVHVPHAHPPRAKTRAGRQSSRGSEIVPQTSPQDPFARVSRGSIMLRRPLVRAGRRKA
jgi:hypothetical protein